jgi:FtsH-binding integral membrane protein
MAVDSSASAQQAFMQKIYAWMVGGLLLTAATAWLTLNVEIIAETVFRTYWMLFLGELGLVFFLSARIEKMSVTTAQIMFAVYSALNGLTLGMIFFSYTLESISTVFLITAGTFGATSLYGYVTKRDLTSIGSFMFMGLIGIIIASVVNIWLQSSALYFAVSVIGVLVFVGLTAYDTQKFKSMYEVELQSPERAAKIAIIGALNLYLDFINMFLFILRLLGSRR